LLSELLREEYVQELRNRVREKNETSFVSLKVLGYGVIAAFKTLLRKEVKTLRSDSRGL
jgi:hypothetical protein